MDSIFQVFENKNLLYLIVENLSIINVFNIRMTCKIFNNVCTDRLRKFTCLKIVDMKWFLDEWFIFKKFPLLINRSTFKNYTLHRMKNEIMKNKKKFIGSFPLRKPYETFSIEYIQQLDKAFCEYKKLFPKIFIRPTLNSFKF